jgi:hypothetical protein
MTVAIPPATSTVLPLDGNGAAEYPGFVGSTSEYYAWSGFQAGVPATLLQQAYTALVGDPSATPHPDFVPPTGTLFVDYPNQIFLIAESVTDYGLTSSASAWMAGTRSANIPGAATGSGAGVETTPSVTPLADDTFAYQTVASASEPSDTYTDIQVRDGAVIYAVSIDSGPTVQAVSIARSLVEQLMAVSAGCS